MLAIADDAAVRAALEAAAEEYPAIQVNKL
jgi:hypothetical protein